MPFHEQNGLRYFWFDIFPAGVKQAVFTRRGGLSPQPWASLNLGGSVGDAPEHVAQNRVHVFKTMDRDPASIHDVWLVHGTDIVHAEAPRLLSEPAPKADILFTDNPDVTLFMRFGDCVPLLFHDPVQKAIGIAHAGWMGTVKGVAEVAVEGMMTRYGSKPEHIQAAIGPSIGVDHYEVGEEVVFQVQEKFGKDAERVIQKRDGSTYLDLWTANLIQLNRAGVTQVEVPEICTACHLEDWFSHRAEKGKTGRFGALMALQP